MSYYLDLNVYVYTVIKINPARQEMLWLNWNGFYLPKYFNIFIFKSFKNAIEIDLVIIHSARTNKALWLKKWDPTYTEQCIF